MTQEDALNQIFSQHKWYVGIYSQCYASQLKARHQAKQLKQSTIEELLRKFGYVLNRPAEWIKSDGKPSNLKTK